MKKTGAPKVRGVFERPAGSGCWWINYYVDGKQHREKVGRRGDALALYQKRKADARRKIKLPELVPGKAVTFGHLSEMAVKYAETHLAVCVRRQIQRHTVKENGEIRAVVEIEWNRVPHPCGVLCRKGGMG